MNGRARASLVSLLVVVVPAILASAYTSAAPQAVIVALGDSLTAGWGVAPDEAYPALLEARLRHEGFAYHVINAGVSGDTTAGGRRRLDWVLRSRPEIVIVALGANDGLRGQPVAEMQANLIAIIERLRSAGAKVLLAGMRLPPNYGAYAHEFAATFPLAGRRATAFAPFLLDGVAATPRLNQADGIHPNAAGHRVIAERLWPYLLPLLRKDGRTSASVLPAGENSWSWSSVPNQKFAGRTVDRRTFDSGHWKSARKAHTRAATSCLLVHARCSS